jgi:DNA-binding transcriptional LysR family regulator
MPIDSNRLEAFYSVAKFSNFSKAAESLGLTQSALSQRVAKLEDELSTNLVIRDSAGIRLTSSGQELLRYCHAQKSLEEELLSNFDLLVI